MMMFSKKNTLPPRPKMPSIEEIIEDLNESVSSDDAVFKLLEKETAFEDHSANFADMQTLNETYEKVKNYLDVSKNLEEIKNIITNSQEQLQNSVKEVTKITHDIKKQAEAALNQ